MRVCFLIRAARTCPKTCHNTSYPQGALHPTYWATTLNEMFPHLASISRFPGGSFRDRFQGSNFSYTSATNREPPLLT